MVIPAVVPSDGGAFLVVWAAVADHIASVAVEVLFALVAEVLGLDSSSPFALKPAAHPKIYTHLLTTNRVWCTTTSILAA